MSKLFFGSVFPGFVSVLLLSASAQAATLQTWRFDPQQNRLDFTTDESVQPTAQLIANPTRLVIDLPGIRLGRPKINQTVGDKIQSIRIGQFDAQTTRLVIELAPGYTIDPQQVMVRGASSTQWAVQLPTPRLDAAASMPAASPATPTDNPQSIATVSPPADSSGLSDLSGLINPGKELVWLQQRVAALRSKYSALQPSLFFLDLDNGNYLNQNGDKVFPTASIIKLPILIAFFQDVDAGKISLDETLVMRPELIVGGSGELQDLPAWSKFSALATINKMITISDNTATNMIIKRMGGINVLNQRFRSWGLQQTVIRNMLPDLKGTNTTTAKELVRLLALLDQGKLLSARSQEQALDILRRVKNKKLLFVGLGPGATIAHKTGDIGFMLGDAGIIVMPSGKHYLGAVLVKSAYDDPAARDYVQDVSRLVYSYLSQPIATSSASP